MKLVFTRPIKTQYQESCHAYNYVFTPTVPKTPECMVINNVCCGDGTYCPQDTTCQMYPYCCPSGNILHYVILAPCNYLVHFQKGIFFAIIILIKLVVACQMMVPNVV